jgi:hypothetical protein
MLYIEESGMDTVVKELKRNRFPKLTKYILTTNRNLEHVVNKGSCCWEFYSKKHFGGDMEHIPSGFEGLPTIKPKSIKKISCPL